MQIAEAPAAASWAEYSGPARIADRRCNQNPSGPWPERPQRQVRRASHYSMPDVCGGGIPLSRSSIRFSGISDEASNPAASNCTVPLTRTFVRKRRRNGLSKPRNEPVLGPGLWAVDHEPNRRLSGGGSPDCLSRPAHELRIRPFLGHHDIRSARHPPARSRRSRARRGPARSGENLEILGQEPYFQQLHIGAGMSSTTRMRAVHDRKRAPQFRKSVFPSRDSPKIGLDRPRGTCRPRWVFWRCRALRSHPWRIALLVALHRVGRHGNDW